MSTPADPATTALTRRDLLPSARSLAAVLLLFAFFPALPILWQVLILAACTAVFAAYVAWVMWIEPHPPPEPGH